MKPTVYLETSVISYLTADFSRDMVIATHQQITRHWWKEHRDKCDLFISLMVLREISEGNQEKAKKRLAFVQDLPVLGAPEGLEDLAKSLISQGPIPENAPEDAVHIALAAMHEIDFILSWNCKHIANFFIQKDLARIMLKKGYRLPIIGTPENLTGGSYDLER